MNNDNKSKAKITDNYKEDIKNSKNKKKKNKKNENWFKDNVLKIVIFLTLLIILVIVALFIINLNTENIEEKDFYQWIGQGKVEYTGAMKILYNGEVSELQTENENIELDFTPVYYKDEPKMLFSNDMALVQPLNNGSMNKLPRFSVLEEKEDGIYLDSRKEDKKIENSFLFNGKDLYVFLEETTIIIDEIEYVVSPMSYANVSYKQMVEIYDKKSDVGNVIITEDSSVIAKTGNYEIDMSIDSLKTGTKEQLLIKTIDSLEIYE